MSSTKSYQFILDFLNNENQVINRKDILLDKMDDSFRSLRDNSSLVIDELIYLTEHNPQTIIDIAKNFLTKRENLSKLIDISYTEKKRGKEKQSALPEELKSIADQFELSGLFILTVYLLSGRKLKLNRLNNPASVLAHLKVLGLNSKDTDIIREIRNAASHKYTFEKEHIVWGKTRIAFTTIHEVNIKLRNLTEWNMTLIFYSMFLVPKFGMLVAATMYTSMKNNYDDWIQYLDGMGIFYKDMLDTIKIEKENTEKNKVKIIREDVPKNADAFVIENLPLISNRLKYHLNTIAGMVSELHNLIKSPEEKEVFQKAETVLRQGGNTMELLLKNFNAHPEKFAKHRIEEKKA